MNQDRARELFDYNPYTGVFVWKVTASSRALAGTVAGMLHIRQGDIRIGIKHRTYMAHRLAWLIVYGELPQGCIRHINGVRSDNRISNLSA